MNRQQQDEYREKIRLEIAAEEKQRKTIDQERKLRFEELHHDQVRQDIQADEKRKFFESSEDYFEFVNENDETEWLTRKQIQAREGYFDYEEHVDNPASGRRKVFFFGVVALIIFMVAVAFGWIYMLEDLASVDVVCNIKEARILVDGQDSGFRTNANIELPAGEHLIEVIKLGYQNSESQIKYVDVKRDDKLLIQFKLQPLVESSK
jgi:hypothetical protein